MSQIWTPVTPEKHDARIIAGRKSTTTFSTPDVSVLKAKLTGGNVTRYVRRRLAVKTGEPLGKRAPSRGSLKPLEASSASDSPLGRNDYGLLFWTHRVACVAAAPQYCRAVRAARELLHALVRGVVEV